MTNKFSEKRDDKNMAKDDVNAGDASKLVLRSGTDSRAGEQGLDLAILGSGERIAPGRATQTKSSEVSDMRAHQAGASRRSRPAKKTGTSSTQPITKTQAALKLLRRRNGATLAELQVATGWQAHSVRGFLSGTVRKKLALPLTHDVTKLGVRRYRIDADAKAG